MRAWTSPLLSIVVSSVLSNISAGVQYLPSATLWVQGMELGLQTLAAAGAMTVVMLQGGKREASRFEVERDKAGNMTNQPAFDSHLRGVRKTGASHPKAKEAVAGGVAD